MLFKKGEVCPLCKQTTEEQMLHREEDRILNEIASAVVDFLAVNGRPSTTKLRTLLYEFNFLAENKQNVANVVDRLVEMEHDLSR